MEQIKVAVMGFGHIGSYATRGILLAADMTLVGVVDLEKRLPDIRKELPEVALATSVDKLPAKPDVVILTVPTRTVETVGPALLESGIRTVDCFDMHGDPFMALQARMNAAALKGNVASILSSGVDPGISTMIRALFEIWAPTGLTYVSYGPGMSMGHTVAAKSYEGVRDAFSVTRPGDPGCHKRDLYLEIEDGYAFDEVKGRILQDPYFSHDDVRVFQVDDVTPLMDMGHAIQIHRKGGSSGIDNQLLSFETTFHNPASTAQVLVASARATTRLSPGAHTMLEVPLGAFLFGDLATSMKRLV